VTEQQTRLCRKCLEYLSLSYFKKNPDSPDGFYAHCRDCIRDRDREYNRTQRMTINGKRVSKSHPLWKPGRYKALDDAWSHAEIDSKSVEGEVYIISNPAWTGWFKVGKAVNSEDRLNGYQTSSPYRDYTLVYKETFYNRNYAETEVHHILRKIASENRNEWFCIDVDLIIQTIAEVKHLEHTDDH
jgi:hypothetical protein